MKKPRTINGSAEGRMTRFQSWFAKFTMADSFDFSDIETRHRLYFFMIANLVAVSVLLGFVVFSAFKGQFLIADFILAAAFVFSHIYLRITKQLLPACVMGASCLLIFLLMHVVTGGIDFSGPLWCFVFPPAAIYLLGVRLGLAFSLLAVLPMIVFLIIRLTGLGTIEYTNSYLIRFLMAYSIETFLFYLDESQKIKSQRDVKLLSGLIPICQHCKSIRDDKGYWNRVERYINRKNDADFSHGICPECAEKYYPDMDLYKD